MAQERTVKEYAAHERVTERTVRNWLSKGAVEYRRTPGGRVRIIERDVRESSVTVITLKNAETCGNPDR